jgi:hypothetical protein
VDHSVAPQFVIFGYLFLIERLQLLGWGAEADSASVGSSEERAGTADGNQRSQIKNQQSRCCSTVQSMGVPVA